MLSLLAALLLPSPALGADDPPPPRIGPGANPPPPPPGSPPEDEGPARLRVTQGGQDAPESTQKPPVLPPNAKVSVDFVDKPIVDLVKWMAEITGRNFILTDDLKGSVTIISHHKVSVAEAYEAFLSALESLGYTTVTVGTTTKIVSTGDAASSPIRVYEGSNIPYTDNFVTQIIQLDNVSVSEISSVVKDLMGSKGKVIAYSPTNTLIITDAATNIRRVYRIVNQLDVAAPKSKMAIVQIHHALASDIQKIIEDLYGTEGSTSSSGGEDASASARERAREARKRRRDRDRETPEEPGGGGGSETKVGGEGKYIEKIIADERTNLLIIMANETALASIQALIAQLDVDVDPASRAQIHVVYLEHAKAEEVATVLANLSEGGSTGKSQSKSKGKQSGKSGERGAAPGAPPRPGERPGAEGLENALEGSAVAAFESGVRITSDENTNSLVIIATPDQFQIIRQVIDKLDIRRKQVFVEAVIMELASNATSEFGLGVHFGAAAEDGGLSIGSAQLGGSSLGLSPDALSGLAMGVFGKSIDVPISGLSSEDGSSSTYSVPAFGIAIQALQSDSSVNILSTPNVLTTDNEEAKIVVGRNIPFPVSTGRDNNNPIVSYQREDVAITLKVTPQINESNYVTLEIFQEVQEVEEDAGGLDVTTAGFITSKREAETVVVVPDNQTVVIGGLIGNTETEVETKVPVLGDLPLIGALFRGHSLEARKTNLLIFLTPHVINEPADLEEVYRVKVAQRQEFIRRFYGKSREEAEIELASLLQYSMNIVDKPSAYRTKVQEHRIEGTIGGEGSSEPVEHKFIEVEPTRPPPEVPPGEDPPEEKEP